MRLIALFLSTMCVASASAQSREEYVVEGGQKISDVISPEATYRFSAFKLGRVAAANNVFYNAKLNYNYLTGEMEFIDPKGDTLAISSEQQKTIDRVGIDTAVFVYNNNAFLEIIKEDKNGILLKRKKFETVTREKIGAYNLPTSTSAVTSYNTITDGGGSVRSLVVREKMTLQMNTSYYVAGSNNKIVLFNKKNLEKLYPTKKADIGTFFASHSAVINDDNEVKKFITSLELQ
jgi:hypothetical protein